MKKAYVKPEIVFESFSLSQCIAAGCEYTDPKHPDLLYSNGEYAFTSSCDVDFSTGGGDGRFGEICYHVPSETLNFFYS